MTRIIERPFDASAAQTLIEQGMLAPLARALAARGIHHIDEMTLDWKGLIPPSQLEGTDLAAARLLEAREKGEPVTIVADYDCDGATACTIAIRGLTTMGLHVSYVVPDRVTQGYGLTPELVDIVKERFSPQLIVTVDNGITSVAAVEHAKALGIDVIVTDHHLPGEEEPAACCIVNPNRKGCSFPSKNLAGVGVMFVPRSSCFNARERLLHMQTQPRLDQWVDLVALGTLADVVKLDKNNRILVAQGLKRVRAGKALPVSVHSLPWREKKPKPPLYVTLVLPLDHVSMPLGD
ncbi:MAG: single-stranded-DNA-specific exonuclease RecJ [Sutterella sp.]